MKEENGVGSTSLRAIKENRKRSYFALAGIWYAMELHNCTSYVERIWPCLRRHMMDFSGVIARDNTAIGLDNILHLPKIVRTSLCHGDNCRKEAAL